MGGGRLAWSGWLFGAPPSEELRQLMHRWCCEKCDKYIVIYVHASSGRVSIRAVLDTNAESPSPESSNRPCIAPPAGHLLAAMMCIPRGDVVRDRFVARMQEMLCKRRSLGAKVSALVDIAAACNMRAGVNMRHCCDIDSPAYIPTVALAARLNQAARAGDWNPPSRMPATAFLSPSLLGSVLRTWPFVAYRSLVHFPTHPSRLRGADRLLWPAKGGAHWRPPVRTSTLSAGKATVQQVAHAALDARHRGGGAVGVMTAALAALKTTSQRKADRKSRCILISPALDVPGVDWRPCAETQPPEPDLETNPSAPTVGLLLAGTAVGGFEWSVHGRNVVQDIQADIIAKGRLTPVRRVQTARARSRPPRDATR